MAALAAEDEEQFVFLGVEERDVVFFDEGVSVVRVGRKDVAGGGHRIDAAFLEPTGRVFTFGSEASAELEESIALRDMATTRCNLAIIRMRQNDAAGAREHARAALRLGDESDSRTETVARRILADVEVLEDQAG